MSPLLGFHFSSVQMSHDPKARGPVGRGEQMPPTQRVWGAGATFPLGCPPPRVVHAASGPRSSGARSSGGSGSGAGGGQRPVAPPHPPAARARRPPRAQPGQGPQHPGARRLAPETHRSGRSARLRCRRPRRHLTQSYVARASGRSRDLAPGACREL